MAWGGGKLGAPTERKTRVVIDHETADAIIRSSSKEFLKLADSMYPPPPDERIRETYSQPGWMAYIGKPLPSKRRTVSAGGLSWRADERRRKHVNYPKLSIV